MIAPAPLLPRCGAEAGFTLIELLIATTVLAFLSLLLFGGLQFGTRVWEKAQTSTTDTNHVRAAQLVLSDEIAHLYPMYVSAPDGKYVEFNGDEQQMTFLAPSKTIPGGMDRITVLSQPTKDHGVSIDIASVAELSGGRTLPVRRTLIGGLKWIRIAYYGSPSAVQTAHSLPMANGGLRQRVAQPPPAGAPQWTAVWKGQSSVPLLVRIRAGFQRKGQWPDLVVAPRSEVDEACVYDQLTKYCQGR